MAAFGLFALASTRLRALGPQFSLMVSVVLSALEKKTTYFPENLEFEPVNMHELQHQDTSAAKIL